MPENELGPVKPAFRVGQQLTGLAARKAKAEAEAKLALEKSGVVEIKEPTANDMPHRIGIVFDDSSSMSNEQIQDAIEGVEEFLRSCTKDQTAVAIYPMNKSGLPLVKNLPAVAVFTKGLRSSGGTPLVDTAENMLRDNNLTRAIIFSDGEPNHERTENIINKGIPIDTVYIPDGYVSPSAEAFMQKLAKDTDGIYLRFERGKSNFRTAFKYLSPGLRHMLADKSFVAKLEGR